MISSSSSESEAQRLSPRLGSCNHEHPYVSGAGAMPWYCRTSTNPDKKFRSENFIDENEGDIPKGRYLKTKVASFRMLETSVEEKGVADDKGRPSSRR